MTVEEFRGYLKNRSGMEIGSADRAAEIFPKLFEIVEPNADRIGKIKGIHYLWSYGFQSKKYLASGRFRHLTEEKCTKFLEEILCGEKYYLIVDDCCFADAKEPICICGGRTDLISTVSELYWELYEIYIVDMNFKWLVAVDHVSEVMLYGSETDEECSKIRDHILKKTDW